MGDNPPGDYKFNHQQMMQRGPTCIPPINQMKSMNLSSQSSSCVPPRQPGQMPPQQLIQRMPHGQSGLQDQMLTNQQGMPPMIGGLNRTPQEYYMQPGQIPPKVGQLPPRAGQIGPGEMLPQPRMHQPEYTGILNKT